MKKKSSRIVALVLTLCMVFFGLPVAAMAEGKVAQIEGGDAYTTLGEAITYAQAGQTIRLMNDTNLDTSLAITKSLTLDLNGKTITSEGLAFAVSNEAKFTVKDSGRNGAITSSNDGNLLKVSSGEIIVESGNLSNEWYVIYVCQTGKATIKGGTLTSTSACVLSTNGSASGANYSAKAVMNVEGGKLVSTNDVTIYLPAGTLNITGGEIVGATAVYSKSGVTNISGNPVIKGEGEDKSFEHIGSGCLPTGDAMVVEACAYPNGNPKVYISGGTFTSEHGESVAYYQYNNNQFEKFSITGGKFFTTDVRAYLAPNMKQDDDGNVVPKTGYEFVVSDMGGYADFDDALDAANQAGDGSVITLWDNVNIPSLAAPLSISKDITITSAEDKKKTITLTNNQGDRSKLIIMSADLTLDNVALTLKPTATGYGDGIQMSSNQNNPVTTLTLQNDAVLTFENNSEQSVQNAFVMPAGAGAKVIVDRSKIIAKGVDGNFSNGGIFTIQHGSTVEISNCDSYALSVNELTVDGSTLTITDTKLSAIRTAGEDSVVSVVNGGNIKVTNSGEGLPRPDNSYSAAKGVIDIGHASRGNATVPASLTVDEKSSIDLENNKNEANFVYLTKDASYAVSGKVTKIVQEELPDNYYSITYTVNEDTYAVIPVSPDELSSGTITFTEPPAPVVSGYTFQGWNYPESANVVAGTVTFPVTAGESEYIVTADLKKKPASSTTDDTPSLGYRLPYIGESAGGKNFVSDTTGNLTVNGKYQFRITSTDGHKPVMTVSNSNFTVELASQSGNDYFYVIRCAGAAGSTANVLVDGIHVVVATVGTAGVVSDTTHPFTVAQGATYQFKLTSASRPTFTGNNANFTIAYVSNSGNDWFFKVTAAGAAGASTTFSANGVVVTTATIA